MELRMKSFRNKVSRKKNSENEKWKIYRPEDTNNFPPFAKFRKRMQKNKGTTDERWRIYQNNSQTNDRFERNNKISLNAFRKNAARHLNDLELPMKIQSINRNPPFVHHFPTRHESMNRINDQKSSRDPTAFNSYNRWNAWNDNRSSRASKLPKTPVCSWDCAFSM